MKDGLDVKLGPVSGAGSNPSSGSGPDSNLPGNAGRYIAWARRQKASGKPAGARWGRFGAIDNMAVLSEGAA